MRLAPWTCHPLLDSGPGASWIRKFIALIFLSIIWVRVFKVTGPVMARADGGRISGVMSLRWNLTGPGPGLAGRMSQITGARKTLRSLTKKPAKGFLVAQSGKRPSVLQGVCLGRHERAAMTRSESRTCHELGVGPSGKPASLRLSLGAACPRSAIPGVSNTLGIRLGVACPSSATPGAGILAQAVRIMAQGSSVPGVQGGAMVLSGFGCRSRAASPRPWLLPVWSASIAIPAG